MDTERLAAYVGGDLAPDEAAAVEAALARDPQLRAEAARLRRLDAALSSLPAVAPRPGFDERLRATVAEELDRLGFDEVAARRVRRAPSRGLRRLGLAAAAAAALGIVGVGVAQLVTGSGQDADTGGEMAALDRAEDAARSGPEMAMVPPSGPLVVSEGRRVQPETVGSFVGGLDLFGRLAGPLSEADPPTVAAVFRDLILGAPAGGSAGDTAAPESGPAEGDDGQADADAAEPAPLTASVAATLEVRGAAPEELEAVRGCLTPVLESETPVIPLYAELVTFEGVAAILYVVASQDPGSGGYDRAEVWVLDRDSCQVRYFGQQ